MADIVINVQPTKEFVFNPNQLTFRVIETNPVEKTATVYFELKETGLPTDRYIAREWVDKGNVKLPLELLNNAYDAEGNIIPAIANQFLSVFNLQVAK